MKKYLVILLAAVVVSTTSFAQFRIGPKFGATMGKINGEKFSDKYSLGYHLGAFAEIPLGKKFALQPEVLWNQIKADTVSGFSNLYSQINENVKDPQLNYLSIPILLSFKPSKILSLQAGPQFGVLLNKNENLIQNGKEAFKNGDLSMLVGAQLNIMRVRIYGRYAIGLQSINDLGNQKDWKSTSIQLGVGLAL